MLDEHYSDREQAQVKHLILNTYLDRFARIIGSWAPSITYVDCFSGPWLSRSADYSDTSFGIALTKLREAQSDCRNANGTIFDIRCYFLERDRGAFEQLEQYSIAQSDAEIRVKNASFEDAVGDVVRFINERPQTFAFVFIDPKGWTGFSMNAIRPLLQSPKCEVLINFMTSQIRRFVRLQDPKLRQGFINLYGSESFLKRIQHLESEHGVEDAPVVAYCEALKEAGKFKHVARAIVLNPTKDDTHYHLIYATRNDKGLEVFKDAERKGMEKQEEIRRKLQSDPTDQLDLFDIDEVSPLLQTYYANLRNNYLRRATTRVKALLSGVNEYSYDEIWAAALSEPMIWKSDLTTCLEGLRKEGIIEYVNLATNARLPKLGQSHLVRRVKE